MEIQRVTKILSLESENGGVQSAFITVLLSTKSFIENKRLNSEYHNLSDSLHHDDIFMNFYEAHTDMKEKRPQYLAKSPKYHFPNPNNTPAADNSSSSASSSMLDVLETSDVFPSFAEPNLTSLFETSVISPSPAGPKSTLLLEL